MRDKRIIYALLLLALTTLIASCNKEHSCYDEELYQQHKNDICPMDCPGVVGCDGKNYCNECIARTKGIKVR